MYTGHSCTLSLHVNRTNNSLRELLAGHKIEENGTGHFRKHNSGVCYTAGAQESTILCLSVLSHKNTRRGEHSNIYSYTTMQLHTRLHVQRQVQGVASPKGWRDMICMHNIGQQGNQTMAGTHGTWLQVLWRQFEHLQFVERTATLKQSLA